ncbi:MAG TPA: hypothetical protein VHE78_12915 [Gemmatimonadaceae bacterium]|nr:hypothetical protein [Gemmatimonadaceae bacterium]
MPPGFVYIIDSPTSFDLLNGRTEGQDVCGELELANIENAYHLAADKEMLEIILRLRIATEVKRRGLPPTLLFSVYAEDKGLRLTSGELVSWSELRGMLVAVRDAQPAGILFCLMRSKGGGLSDLFVRRW